MKYLVLGIGKSGAAAFDHLWEKGEEVFGVDRKFTHARPPFYPEDFIFEPFDFDQIILSPGIRTDHPICQRAVREGIEIIGEVELALRNYDGPCIGVTGTNGKTTVVSMCTHVLNSCGKKAYAVGNIGRGVINAPKDGILVIELSSYQLETMHSRVFDSGAILNITPDHLDRYESMDEYRRVKMRLIPLVKGPCFVNKDWSNKEYAFRLVEPFGVEREAFNLAISTFKKPEHRIEFVKEVDGISFYNDSKGTNVASVAFAVSQMEGSTIVIAGGVHKGEPYTALQEPFREKVRHLFVFGQAASLIASDLRDSVAITEVKTLAEAFALAKRLARPGEAVLLSPGCSSFDQFANFEERGLRFKELVNE